MKLRKLCVLKIIDIYSRESIEKIVENFDFSKINLESKYEYTKEGFLKAVLKSLDETVLSK